MRLKNYRGAVLLIVAGAGFFVACSDSGKKSAADYPAKISVVDGVTTVMNPDYPRDGRVTYDMIEEVSIGEKEGDERYIFGTPRAVQAAENGDIYVLDWSDVTIRVYEKNGRHLRTIGRQGQGPGDFMMPCGFCLASDGRICILDVSNSRISIMDGNGAFLMGIPLTGASFYLGIDVNDMLYFSRSTASPALGVGTFQLYQRNKLFLRADAETGALTELFQFKGDQWLRRPVEGGGVAVVNGWFESLWAVCPLGGISIGYNETYEVSHYDANGRLQLKFGRASKPRKYISPILDSKDPNYVGMKERQKYEPDHEPYFSEFVVDEAGHLWVMIPAEKGESSCVYDVFTPEGIYSRQVKTEHSISLFKNGRAYSIITSGEDGISMVKRFRPEEKP